MLFIFSRVFLSDHLVPVLLVTVSQTTRQKGSMSQQGAQDNAGTGFLRMLYFVVHVSVSLAACPQCSLLLSVSQPWPVISIIEATCEKSDSQALPKTRPIGLSRGESAAAALLNFSFLSFFLSFFGFLGPYL